MESLTVSTIIPLYNGGLTIERAIRSVLAQNCPATELIVVDDGSTDEGPRLARSVGQSTLRVVSQENSGVSAARNRGIKEARSQYVAFLDSDDEWEPTFLQMIVELQKSYPRSKLLATNYYRGNNLANRRPARVHGLQPGWSGVMPNFFRTARLAEPPIHSSSVVVEKALIESIDGFPLNVQNGEDLLTWARLALRSPVAYANNPCATFWETQPTGNMSKRMPDPDDLIGRRLREEISTCPSNLVAEFRRYVAHWYKMRAHYWLQVGRSSEAIQAALVGVRLNPRAPKLYAMLLLAFGPDRVVRYLARPK